MMSWNPEPTLKGSDLAGSLLRSCMCNSLQLGRASALWALLHIYNPHNLRHSWRFIFTSKCWCSMACCAVDALQHLFRCSILFNPAGQLLNHTGSCCCCSYLVPTGSNTAGNLRTAAAAVDPSLLLLLLQLLHLLLAGRL